MELMNKFVALFSVVSAIAVAGCSGGEAYVDRPWEIDRDRADFPYGPELRDGQTIAVCYSKSGNRPADVLRLANEECSKAGLTARLDEQIYGGCPIYTPTRAVFVCGAAVATKGQAPVTARPSSPGVNFAPTNAPVKGSVLPDNFGANNVSTTAKSEPFPTFLFNDPNRPAQ